MKKLRIVFVFEIFLPTITGIITATANLAQNLIDQGHEAFCLAPQWKETPATFLDNAVPVMQIPSISSNIYPGLRLCLPWSVAPRIFLETMKIDIVHITGPGTLARASIRAARKYNIPVVHTWHTMLHEHGYLQHLARNHLSLFLLRKYGWISYQSLIYKSTVITTPTTAVQNMLQKKYPDIDIRTISNGVDMASFKSFATLSKLQRQFPTFDEKTFLYVGRTSREKSIELLIYAIDLLRNQGSHQKLFIIGEGPDRTALQQLVHRLSLEKQIYFTGAIAHNTLLTSGLLHHARAMVSASETETQGVTFIESLCAHTPVIAIDSDITRSVIGRAGILFPRGNCAALAHAMQSMSEDSVYQQCMATTEKQCKPYDGRIVSRKYLALYGELVNQIDT